MMKKPIQNDLKANLLDNIPLIVALHDTNKNVIWANKAYQKATGLSLQDIEGKKCYIIRGLAEPCSNCPLTKAIETGESCKAELTPWNQGNPPGTQGSWLIRATAIRDEGGSIVGAVEVAYDTTKRKQAENALREREEQLQTLIDAMPDFICFKDGEGRWLKANDAGIRIFQLEGIDYRGKKDSELAELSSRLRGAFLTCEESDAMAWNENSLFRGEETIPQPDGTARTYDVVKVPVFHPDGERKGLVVLGHDITEHMQAEEALRESEEKYRSLTENMSDIVYSLDLNGVVTYISPQTKQYGIDPETIISKNLLEIVHPEDRNNISNEYQRVIETGEEFPSIFRVLDLDGGIHWFEDIGRIQRDKEENITGLAGVLRDITERKKTEEEKARIEDQYRQAQKMESVGRLAGGVAHDFNNMLGVIIGYTEMSLDELDPTHPVYAALQEIRKAADRSTNLTRQLLAFARRQTVSPRVLDLNETVEGMLKMLHRLIGEDIDLTWLPGADLWPVRVDPAQIDQILANLCVNGRDAIAGVGKMTIGTEDVVLNESFCQKHPGSISGEYVLLTVSDDGCGMTTETMDNLFEPFFTTKEVGQGTGLGLATVYGIVKQNNGFIYVNSEPGEGSSFRIYLPRYEGKTTQIRKEGPAEPVRCGHETILLVEDEPAILKMATTMLERQGYTVIPAITPGEAIRLAGKYDSEIHMLMTDVIMPEMNGRDLAKNVLSLFPKIKRLFMSGYTANVIAHRRVLDEGVNFIQKPFTMQYLATKVREVLDNE